MFQVEGGIVLCVEGISVWGTCLGEKGIVQPGKRKTSWGHGVPNDFFFIFNYSEVLHVQYLDLLTTSEKQASTTIQFFLSIMGQHGRR